MGKGGREAAVSAHKAAALRSHVAQSKQKTAVVPLLEKRAPSGEPPATFAALKAAIPKHCFERSAARSLAHLATDLLAVALCVGAMRAADGALQHGAARGVAWLLYWYWAGAFGTGLWVLAHECGHGAFSASPLLNDVVGFVVHSLLGVPYFSWKYTHARHHGGTNSMERDEVFVPVTAQNAPLLDKPWGYSLPVRLTYFVITFTAGWPLYLALNVASREHKGHWLVNHFTPWAPIFNKREAFYVALSDLGLVAVGAVVWKAAQAAGWAAVAKYYIVPVMVVNFWLVMITFLQHTHPSVPHYSGEDWTWLKGALSTVDRSFGYTLDRIFHRIVDTHVAHHLFSYIPFYHAEEATNAIKPLLGEHYLVDHRPIFQALWQDWGKCRYVDSEEATGKGVLWWKVDPICTKRD